MSRQKGSANLAASLEVQAEAPLDARTVVERESDLTTTLNFPYAYVGMPVFVKENSKLYILTAADRTTPSNWKEVGRSEIEVVSELPEWYAIQDKIYHHRYYSPFDLINLHAYYNNDGTPDDTYDNIAAMISNEVYEQSGGVYTFDQDISVKISSQSGFMIFVYTGPGNPPLVNGKRAKYIVYWHNWDGNESINDYREIRFFEPDVNPRVGEYFYAESHDFSAYTDEDKLYNLFISISFDTIAISDLYAGDSEAGELIKIQTTPPLEVVDTLPTGSSIKDKVYNHKASDPVFPTMNVHLFDTMGGSITRDSEVVMNTIGYEIYTQSNEKFIPDIPGMIKDPDHIAGSLTCTYSGSDDPPLIHGKRAKYIVYWQDWDGESIVTNNDPRRFRYFEANQNPSSSASNPYYEEYIYADDIPMDEKLSTTHDIVFDTIDTSDLYVGDSQDETLKKLATEDDISELQTNFQAGVDSVYNALDAKGLTPSSKSLSDVVSTISGITPAATILGGNSGSATHNFRNVKNGDYIILIHYQYNTNVSPTNIPSTLTEVRRFAYSSTKTNAILYMANTDISSLSISGSYATFALHITVKSY